MPLPEIVQLEKRFEMWASSCQDCLHAKVIAEFLLPIIWLYLSKNIWPNLGFNLASNYPWTKRPEILVLTGRAKLKKFQRMDNIQIREGNFRKNQLSPFKFKFVYFPPNPPKLSLPNDYDLFIFCRCLSHVTCIPPTNHSKTVLAPPFNVQAY